MSSVSELISARWIIPVEPHDVVLVDHSLLVSEGRIRAIMPTVEAKRVYPEVPQTVLSQHVLIPGLVNTHNHAAMVLMRGLADDRALMDWLQNHIWPTEKEHLSAEMVYDGTELACAEMIRSGTTCFADFYFHHDQVARAARALGMRAVVGGAVLEFPTSYASDADAYIERAVACRDMIAADPLLKLALTPHAPYTVADSTFKKVMTLAAEMDDLTVMVHVHETSSEITDSLKAHGVRPIERLHQLGVLGPNLVAVHCVHMTPIELELFARLGVHVAHCPVSNLKLASGIAPVKAMLEAGINVTIGTDGSASNNRQDMFAETRMASLLQKGVSGDASAVPAHQALRMATLNGAKALGWEADIGSLVVGKSADITAVDFSSLETSPCYDPASHLLHAAGREHVSHVWVAGKRLLSNGVLTTTDTDAIKAKAAIWQERFRTGEMNRASN